MMLAKSKNERQLVTLLVRPIVSEIVPDEQEEFEELVEDYFKRSRGSDLTLGSGFDLWPDMFYVLLFTTHVLSILTKKAAQRSALWLKWIVRRQVLAAWKENAEQLRDPFSPRDTRRRRKSLPGVSREDIDAAVALGRTFLIERARSEDFKKHNLDKLVDLTRARLLNILMFEPFDLALRVTTRVQDAQTHLDFELHSPNWAADFHLVRFPGHAFKGKPESLYQRISEAMSAPHPVDELTDLGRELYRELFPQELRAAYRSLPKHVRTLQITSDEPWIPWELVKPYDDTDEQTVVDDDFLCMRFQMTRWLAANHGPPMVIEPGGVLALDAGQAWSDAPLSHSSEECRTVADLASRHPEWTQITTPSLTVKSIADLLGEGAALIHFVARGHFDEEHPDDSAIILSEQEDQMLRPRHLEGPPRRGIRQRRPLVFLHVQESARLGWSLSGLAGWPARWVKDCSCGALVAPSWEVDRELALLFARSFYSALEEGRSISSAMLEARSCLRSQAPESSMWLRYVTYAHPNARLLPGTRLQAASERRQCADVPRTNRAPGSP